MTTIGTSAFTAAAIAQSVYAATRDTGLRAQFYLPKQQTPFCVFDLQKSETYQHTGKITRFPIEQGADVTDHIITEPFSLELECLITDTPFDTEQLLKTALGDLASVAGPLGVAAAAGATAAYNYNFGSDTPKSIDKYQLIRLAWEQGYTFQVVTKLDTYDNMMIEKFTVPRDVAISGGLMFNISLVKVNIATGQTVSSQDLANPPGSMGKSDVGNQSSDKDSSIADRWKDGIKAEGVAKQTLTDKLTAARSALGI